MKTMMKRGLAVAVLGLAAPGAVFADTAETKGGIKITSDDGQFQASLGGRIHLDANLIDKDEPGTRSSADFSDAFFRRARLTLSGKAYGWGYKFEQDFAGGPPSERDMYISKGLGGGTLLLGQFKPFRGMEEMTSSNELTAMERPVVQAGFFGDQQFAIGAGYKGGIGNATYALAVQNRKVDGDRNNATESLVSSARFTYAPVAEAGRVLHLGISASQDNTVGTPAAVAPEAGYAGRNVSTVNLSSDAADKGRFGGLEAAATFGPFYLQAEYAQGDLEIATGDEEVVAYYVQTSYFLTGETKPYKGGVFKSPKPSSPRGALELVGRYEHAENKDITDAELNSMLVGLNWYLNPNVRLMANYVVGEAKGPLTGGPDDEPKVFSLRTQLSF